MSNKSSLTYFFVVILYEIIYVVVLFFINYAYHNKLKKDLPCL